MRSLVLVSVLSTLLLGVSSPSAASTSDAITINGFGSWAVGDTDGNSYLGGAEDREYDKADFALAITAEVSDRLTVNGQFFADIRDEESQVDLEFAFAEWTFSDQLRLRGGIVKQPFGLSTEIFHVGTARPFFDLPQGIYGASEIVSVAYRGAGITGHRAFGDWDLSYDAYGGEIELEPGTEFVNPLLFAALMDEDELEEAEPSETIKDMLGGRLTLQNLSGLSFGVSAYTGRPEDDDGDEASDHEVLGMHVQYTPGLWELRAEYAHRQGGDEDVEVTAFYVEVARRFGDHWQAGVRWDQAEFEPEIDIEPASLRDHEDLAVTLNYWFSPNFVIKLGLHEVDGNLFAIPEGEDDSRTLDLEAPLDESTRLLQIGLQFSF